MQYDVRIYNANRSQRTAAWNDLLVEVGGQNIPFLSLAITEQLRVFSQLRPYDRRVADGYLQKLGCDSLVRILRSVPQAPPLGEQDAG